MASTHNHEERIRRSMERMKLLRAGGEIDCPLCNKGRGFTGFLFMIFVFAYGRKCYFSVK